MKDIANKNQACKYKYRKEGYGLIG